MKQILHFSLFMFMVLIPAPVLLSQSSTQMPPGSKEGEVFVSGGHSVPGGRGDSGSFQAGFRFGLVLLSARKSNFEYSIDVIPVYFITQRQNAFGASFTPFNLKYNWTGFHRIVPYVELGGGVLFTNHDVPDRTNSVNFTPQAGIGMHIAMNSGSNRHLGLALKYIHISNAGLSVPNPGLNTVVVKLSIGHFCSLDTSTYTDQTSKCKYYRP
jgi:Lipid A 3-O-deacylase (PagL)